MRFNFADIVRYFQTAFLMLVFSPIGQNFYVSKNECLLEVFLQSFNESEHKQTTMFYSFM